MHVTVSTHMCTATHTHTPCNVYTYSMHTESFSHTNTPMHIRVSVFVHIAQPHVCTHTYANVGKFDKVLLWFQSFSQRMRCSNGHMRNKDDHRPAPIVEATIRLKAAFALLTTDPICSAYYQASCLLRQSEGEPVSTSKHTGISALQAHMSCVSSGLCYLWGKACVLLSTLYKHFLYIPDCSWLPGSLALNFWTWDTV
jgi:hypothetical protein